MMEVLISTPPVKKLLGKKLFNIFEALKNPKYYVVILVEPRPSHGWNPIEIRVFIFF